MWTKQTSLPYSFLKPFEDPAHLSLGTTFEILSQIFCDSCHYTCNPKCFPIPLELEIQNIINTAV